MKKHQTVDGYLQDLPESHRDELIKIRNLVKSQLPEVEEIISYGIPAFKYHKKILIYYAAHSKHMSIYPASDEMINAVGPKLVKYRSSKGTLQFTADKPIPPSLLKKIINFRARTIDDAS
ncbi:MAG: hypothetical protein KatS3mg101_1185 [Patescibacteria group bacterium]|nr:MAG: hypothetical protein KatS3mg035_2087 [Bacteroidia bacterium]GIW61208.1 MAG: hypothetical protein KatS3mg089_0060 [Patescibacteria group bacterium]GIW70438.1 MAG: hypothetical protein KatS3mg101_1185 [Patescibacteria group bacterium]